MKWSESELEELKLIYSDPKRPLLGALKEFSRRINRLPSNVCRKAKALGLETNQSRPKVLQRKKRRKSIDADDLVKLQSEAAKARIARHGHPRGMLGKKHSAEVKARIAEASTDAWEKMTPERLSIRSIKARQTKFANGTVNERHNVTWKGGWRDIGGKHCYYRSRWEANYARFLEWCKNRGDIKEWEHEPEIFWFNGIRRGTVSYLPDFRIVWSDGSIEYHEVKGWMDDRSATKIKRMGKYYPNVKLVVIGAKAYKNLEEKCSRIVQGWETAVRVKSKQPGVRIEI